MPTNIRFGNNCLSGLEEALEHSCASRIALFVGGKSAQTSGALKVLNKALLKYSVVNYTGIKPNPQLETLEDGIKLCKKEKIDLIIGLGGGSVIDYAKAVSVLTKEKGKIKEFFYKKRKFKGNKIKFIAIPTTFGTSSEITPYSVMTDVKRGTKITLSHKSMFPEYAFIDPKFSLSMPKKVMASSCADLFSHAVEAYWSVGATEATDSFAAASIKLFLKHYQKTFKAPRNLKAREYLSLAGVYAGLAFSNTRTTACHALSYPLTTVFGVPHGIACALTLAEMLKLNSRAVPSKIEVLCNIMGCKNITTAQKKINKVWNNLKIKTRLRDYGLSKNDLQVVLEKGFIPEKMANNPYRVTKQDLKRMLQSVY